MNFSFYMQFIWFKIFIITVQMMNDLEYILRGYCLLTWRQTQSFTHARHIFTRETKLEKLPTTNCRRCSHVCKQITPTWKDLQERYRHPPCITDLLLVSLFRLMWWGYKTPSWDAKLWPCQQVTDVIKLGIDIFNRNSKTKKGSCKYSLTL